MAVLKWLWRLLFIVLTLVAVAAGGVYYGVTQPMQLKENTIYEVQSGATSQRIGMQLEARGWIYHWSLAKIASRLNPQWIPKAGEYEIKPGMTLLDALALFDSGKAVHYRLTLVEGKTTKEYLKAMAAKGNIKMTLQGLSNQQIAGQLGIREGHAEGQFFADTYLYYDGDSDADILKRANKQLKRTLFKVWQDRDERLPYDSPVDVLTMASIIEKETGVAEERPLIAGVFINRLRRGIRLQTDPTVIYGLGDAFDGNLTRAHLRMDTPYNTYRIFGLPPTPIANVGASAIEAAMKPARTDALYFVAKGDGTHEFSRTLKDHNRAVLKYQKSQRSKNYTSTPSN